MAVARKFIDKNVLMNVIRHTDAHNKIQEEKEMWKAYEQKKGSKNTTESTSKSRSFDGKMRCDEGVPKSTHYMQELYNFEANDSERWGHSGYNELYPEDVDDNTGNSEGKTRKKKNRKEKGERKKTKKDKGKETWKIRKSEDGDQDGKKTKRPKSERSTSKRKKQTDNDSESLKDNKRRKKADHTSRKRKKKRERDISTVKVPKKQRTE